MTTFLLETRWKTVRCDHCGAEFAYRVQPHYQVPVHCPACGHYQGAMARLARREAFGVLMACGVACGLLALAVGALSASVLSALPLLAVGAVLSATGWLRSRQLDPNAEAASRAGIRQACVVLREDYELARSLARRRAQPFMALSWRPLVHRADERLAA